MGAVIGFSLTSGFFSNKTPDIKTFSSNGINITLTDEFKEADVENFTVSYESKNVAVVALKESFTLADGFEDYTLEQYANLVIKTNNLGSPEIKNVEGLTYFEYNFTNQETKDVYRYFSYVYKADDAFWLIQFATLNENADDYAKQITEWAKSEEFTNDKLK